MVTTSQVNASRQLEDDLGMDPRRREHDQRVPEVIVRELSADDEAEFVSLASESAAFHEKWIKVPRYSEAFKRYLATLDDQGSMCLVIHGVLLGSIVGFVSLTGIEREPYHRGRLGYGVFEPYARRGYTSAGLSQVLELAFKGLELHRLEADIQPDNIPSKNLMKRMGFTRESLSPGFIRINDKWTDHERWALTIEQWHG